MKKLLYLFFAISIISCSKDDSSEPQTFTEKYNGVVWIGDDSVPDDSYFVAVYNQPEKLYYWETDLDGEYCFPVTFGQEDEFGTTTTIIENTLNNLILNVVDSEEEWNIRLTVNNDFNSLTVNYQCDGCGTEYYVRSSSTNPCL